MSKSAANSKADTAVKLVLIFFISLLSFSVGTYVGKQVSDSDSRRAALEADYSGGEQVAAHDATPTDDATAPISDEEVSSLTEEFVQSERKVASEEAAAQPAPAATKATQDSTTADGYKHHSKLKGDAHEAAIAAQPKVTQVPEPTVASATPAPAPTPTPAHNAEVSTAAERVSNSLAPTPDLKKVREPTNVLPTVATTAIGKYTVQVASYATEIEAKDQAAKLTGKGYSAFYVSATVNGKPWYRVSVGLFSDQKSATNYRTELLATQAVSSAIVQKIVK